MTVILEVPQGKSVSYQIPVIRMQDYTMEYIIEHKLFILFPFLFFNYEKHLRKAPNDRNLYEEILNLYDLILSRLKELVDSEVITAYEASTIYDALKIVFEALGKTNKAEEEVANIMGGTILEFSADKYYDAGKAEGNTKGRAEGKAEGKAEDVINLMATMGWDVETTMANMKVSDEEKSVIKKIVEKKLQAVSA
jgi:hypothetical protein